MKDNHSRDWYGLLVILHDMKWQAKRLGRLPMNWTDDEFDKRYQKKQKPFRCIGYNHKIRQINIIQKVMDRIETLDKGGEA